MREWSETGRKDTSYFFSKYNQEYILRWSCNKLNFGMKKLQMRDQTSKRSPFNFKNIWNKVDELDYVTINKSYQILNCRNEKKNET